MGTPGVMRGRSQSHRCARVPPRARCRGLVSQILRKLAQASTQVACGGSFRVDDDLADPDPAASRRAAKNIPEHVKIGQ